MRELPLDLHLARAEHHRKIGNVLAESGQPWAAVPLFYSAYHLARHALRSDPIFDDPARLGRLTLQVGPEDQYAYHHHSRGRKQEGNWGVNDLLAFLYPHAATGYEELHQASNEVRYGAGIIELPLVAFVQKLDTFTAQHSHGELATAKGR